MLACRAGHVIEGRAFEPSGPSASSCPICGAETLSACLGCREPLHSGGVSLPRYCHCCGRPFPWTELVLSKVRSIIREIATLDQYERDQLRRSIDHIVHETPQTRLAVVRVNATLARLGGESAATLRSLLQEIASAGVRPLLQPASESGLPEGS